MFSRLSLRQRITVTKRRVGHPFRLPGQCPGSDTFPITSFSRIYLRKADTTPASLLRDFLGWIYTQGQPFVSEDGYCKPPVPLLSEVKQRVKNPSAADSPNPGGPDTLRVLRAQ